MMLHTLIIGEKNVGKTTLIRTILSNWNLPLSGYETRKEDAATVAVLPEADEIDIQIDVNLTGLTGSLSYGFLRVIDDWLLELWHGPTGAFKDVALQLLPHLMTAARTHNKHNNMLS